MRDSRAALGNLADLRDPFFFFLSFHRPVFGLVPRLALSRPHLWQAGRMAPNSPFSALFLKGTAPTPLYTSCRACIFIFSPLHRDIYSQFSVVRECFLTSLH